MVSTVSRIWKPDKTLTLVFEIVLNAPSGAATQMNYCFEWLMNSCNLPFNLPTSEALF